MTQERLPRPTRRRPVLGILLGALILLGILAVVPWAFHIGGRWTPLLTWWGAGKLVTRSGAELPLFVTIYPSSHFSRLALQGRRPTGGVQGSACLCTAPGTAQYLKLSGTLYDGWWSTEGSLIEFRLLEQTIIDVGQTRAGYFDLMGQWRGQDLVMSASGSPRPLRSGTRVEPASVTFHWHPYWSCHSVCTSAVNKSSIVEIK